MTIAEWFNSEPVKQFRLGLLGDQKHSACQSCHIEESFGGNSKRHKSLQKSVIFQRQAFDASYQQSPGYKHFEHSRLNHGHTPTHPIDMHIDLGNYCNLACKMCNAKASSTIAAQEVYWGIESSRQYLGQDWSRDPTTWNRFLNELVAIPKLQNIHFMGGETLLTPRFEQLVDFFIAAKRFDVCFSFVTNGTAFRPELMEKLTQFRRVGIEVSIETTDQHNTYVRQGTDTELVMTNIIKYQQFANNTSITVTLRPAPSALTVGYFDQLLQFALDQQLVVKSNMCYRPKFLNPIVLPDSVKEQYLERYNQFIKQLDHVDTSKDYNASDPNNYRTIAKQQAEMIKEILIAPTPDNVENLWAQLVAHCKKWDQVYNYNARVLYPELEQIWNSYGY